MGAFSRLIGQQQAVELLTRAVASNRIAPAYLFSGPVGVGRSLAAIEFSILLLAGQQASSLTRQRVEAQNHPDLLQIEPTYLYQGKRFTQAQAEAEGLQRKAQPIIRVEQIREISRFLSRPPLEASRAAVVIKAADAMAEAAANALLKTLEEPGNATIILIAPSPDALLPTLVSRCQRIPFFRLAEAELKQVLAQTDHSDIIDQETVLAIAQGSPGEAIAATEYLQAIPEDLLKQLEQLIADKQSYLKRIESALNLAKNISNSLEFSTQIWLINYLQQCYWKQYLHGQFSLDIQEGLKQLESTRQLLLNYVQPRLVWEVTLMNLVQSVAFSI